MEIWVGAAAAALERGQNVPLPGAHGVLRGTARRADPLYLEAPGAVGRALVCLAMLGQWHVEPVPPFRWGGAHWLAPASAWFELDHGDPRLNAVPPAERWHCLLRALLAVVERWAAEVGAIDECRRRRELARRARQWADAAEPALLKLVQQRRRNDSNAMAYPGPTGGAPGQADPRWARVRSLLSEGAHPEALLQTLLALHLLHAHLGLPQPTLDDHREYAGRTAFYTALLDLLRHSQTGAAGAVVGRLLPVLEQLVLLAGPAARLRTAALLPGLPACFGPYRGDPPPLPALLRRWAGGGAAGQRLEEAAWFGELLADALLDPLRVRHGAEVPGLRVRHYAWPEEAARRFARQRAWPAEARTHLQASARYLNQMLEGRLAEFSRTHLPPVCGPVRWTADANALHFIDR